MYLAQLRIKPREGRPLNPAESLLNYTHYAAGYEGTYTGTPGYGPSTPAADSSASLKLMSLQGVTPVIEAAQSVTREVFDVRADNADWVDALGQHGRTIILSESLATAGVAHYLYLARESSGVAIASSDYPDGTGKQGFVLFSSGQWKQAPDRVPLKPYLVASTTAEIDHSLHRRAQRSEAGVAAFGIDSETFFGGVTPETPRANRAATAVMRLYTPNVGVPALLDPSTDVGARAFAFQNHLTPANTEYALSAA